MRINGIDRPYFGQLFWAGLATAPFLPSTVAPVGLTPGGLPVGLQLIGNYFQEGQLLHAAHALQQATDFHTRAPAGF